MPGRPDRASAVVLRPVGATRGGAARTWLAPVLVAFLTATGCGASDEPQQRSPGTPESSDPGPIHVHGLGVNPADHALFIATHTGLFRLADGAKKAARVAGRWQDTMGFTVVGPDRFLASGHPDGRDKLPPFLGLIQSRDAGRTWRPLSLLGEQDFHVLEASGRTVYGYGSDWKTRRPGLLVSEDGGRSWRRRRGAPEIHDLAIDPRAPERALAASADGVLATPDGGSSWRRRGGQAALIEWPDPGSLYMIDTSGGVWASRDAGARASRRGEIGGAPHAFVAAGGRLYAALEGGLIKRSDDAGRTWAVAFAP